MLVNRMYIIKLYFKTSKKIQINPVALEEYNEMILMENTEFGIRCP